MFTEDITIWMDSCSSPVQAKKPHLLFFPQPHREGENSKLTCHLSHLLEPAQGLSVFLSYKGIIQAPSSHILIQHLRPINPLALPQVHDVTDLYL